MIIPAERLSASELHQKTINLNYYTFVHGYHVVNTTASYTISPSGYSGTAHIFTKGLASWFLTVNLTSTVEGEFQNNKAQPTSYDIKGFSRGKNRHIHLSFDPNGPKVVTLKPVENDRETIPKDQLKSSVDILSSLVTLLHDLQINHSCNESGSVFDGLRLMHIDSHGPSIENIPTDHHPYYKGQSLRCDFTGRQIYGFATNSSQKSKQSALQNGTAWFKVREDGQVVPVKIEFHHPKLGKILMILNSSFDSTLSH